MGIDRKISRRSVAKGLVTGSVVALAGFPKQLEAEALPSVKMSPSAAQTAAWEEVFPGVWRGRIGVPENFTPVNARLIPPQVDGFKVLPAVSKAPLPDLVGAVTSRGCTVELPLRPEEKVYGLGLQFLSMEQRGKKKVVRVNADPRQDTGDSNAPVPFYVTTEGIGILIDTARYAEFYFGDARPKPTHAAKTGYQKDIAPNYTHNLNAQDVGRVIVEVPRATGVDVYLFAGPSMLGAVRRYNVFSGGGVVPPEWGLGFWYRADGSANQQEVLKLAKELREEKIPCDVIGLEPGWQSHAYSCTFAWNEERFPDPAGFIRESKKLGYKVNLWEHAFTNPASPIFTELEPHSGDYGVWGGLVPDFAGKAARRTFGDYHGKTFVDAGISGFKLDECDNSDYTGGWSFPELSRFPSGVDGEQMHSVFGLRYQHALFEQFRERRQPTYSLVRSTGALATPYPFVVYSDLYNHRWFIRALVNSGFSGLLWCPEVRDAVDVEDLIRRLQSVVFSPLAMVNGWYINNPPWKQINRKLNNAGTFMDDWQKVQARCREIIEWRMRLVPYLTAAFQRYAHDGTPPFRALLLDYPDDYKLQRVDDQYMMGDRMMVAPLFAGEASRKIIFPEGQWHDFWSGKPVEGGSELTVDAATKNIPVYIKGGSVVPWADVGLHAEAPETRRMRVLVYGDGSLPIELRSDGKVLRIEWRDGKGMAAETGRASNTYDVYGWKRMD